MQPCKLEDILSLNHQGIHNFSLGCLDSYFELFDEIQRETALFDLSGILVLRKAKKVYVFSALADKQLLQELQKEYITYSIGSLELEKGSKFVEVVYDLDQVLDPKSYPNKKKRFNRIVYPFKQIEKLGIQCSSCYDLAAVEALHDSWVAYKLSLPSTYQIMFPRKRYIRCVEKCLEGSKIPGLQYRGFFYTWDKPEEKIVLDQSDMLLSVRIVAIQDDWAFDLANFTGTWFGPSQVSNYLDIDVLKQLRDVGVKKFNCGAALNKGLETFKTHYPSSEAVSFKYSSTKKERREAKKLF